MSEARPCVYLIEGGRPLRGRVRTEGAKNAALPLLVATLLTDAPVTLHDVPAIGDVETMTAMLSRLGKAVERAGGRYRVREDGPLRHEAPYALVRRMRASFIVLGPLLARCGEARVPLPGGCVLGPRPVDFHLTGLQAMGAKIELHEGVVHARARRLHGAQVYLDFPSVGATEHLMMTAALVPEPVVIHQPAQEPEVHNLAALLERMGAQIRFGADRLEVRGRPRLAGAEIAVIPDRINAGTYLLAGAISGGEVTVRCVPEHLEALSVKLREAGFQLDEGKETLTVRARERGCGLRLETRPYPGFPNDLQPQMTALLSRAAGESLVRETVFPDRFGHVPELVRMGARIRITGDLALIRGVPRLEGTEVHATDIRAGAALVLAGLAARGRTRVVDPGHIARGYPDLAGTLSRLGARIERAPLPNADA